MIVCNPFAGAFDENIKLIEKEFNLNISCNFHFHREIKMMKIPNFTMNN